MSKRIGEVLVQKGLLTQGELEVGLNAQLVFGGHLGTCLIEQGLVSENDLGQALAESYGVGYAGAESLDAVPGPVVECVPAKLAEKYSMIPFRLENGTLHFAMINPREVDGITAAACATGFRTKAWVAPEIRIYQALERYYRVPRRLRFVALCRELDRASSAERLPKIDPSADRAPRADGWPPPEQKPVYDMGGAGERSSSTEHRDLQDLGAEFGYGQSWRELATDEIWSERRAAAKTSAASVSVSPPALPSPPAPASTPGATGPVPTILPVSGGAPVPRAARLTLNEAAERLVGSDTPDQVASAFLDWAVCGTSRCLLWRVDRVTAILWDWRGFAVSSAARERLTLRVTEEPLFRLVAGSTRYRGPVPADPVYRGFFDRLGVKAAGEIELLPLHMDDRLVALFYGDSGTEPAISVPSSDYRRALLKLGYALWMLRLKQKIRRA